MSGERFDDEPAHSPYSPSSAEGWSTCLDYVNANRGLPDNAGQMAAEGTAAHQISDECLTFGTSAYDYIGQNLKVREWTFTWSLDDAEMLQPGIDWVRSLDGTFVGEHRVDTSQWTVEGQFGTLDRAIICEIEGELYIVIDDLKWGRGVAVSPVRNKQLVLYALAFWNAVKHRFNIGQIPRFMLVVDQPRCPGGGGFWRTTLEELTEIGTWLRLSARISESQPGASERTASELGCMWCRRKDAPGGCNAYESWRLANIDLHFEDLDTEPLPERTTMMTPERRATLLRHSRGIERWLEFHETQALRDGIEGRPIGSIKVVVDPRKGPRDKWYDEEAAAAHITPLLGENGFTKKLKAPRQITMQLSDSDKNGIEELINRGHSGHSLVPLSDARAAVQPITGSEFDDLN